MKYLLLMMVLAFLPACGPLTFRVSVTGAQRELESTVVHQDRGAGSDKVAVVDVTGLIYNAAKPGLLRPGENPVATLHEKLNKAERDDTVKAVILRLNSPGGTVTASDMMYRQVRRFRVRAGKPVVVVMADVAASGGYYLACAADEIVAYPTTITGSIGVIIQTISVKPALGRLGVTTEAIVSGPNKDMGSPLATLSEEERALLQGIVDDFYGRFVAVVRKRRRLPEDRVGRVTDGRVFTGQQAVELNLVDRLGDLYDGFDRAKALAGLERAKMVLYHWPGRRADSPYATGSAASGGTQINLAQINLNDGGLALPGMPGGAQVGFYYLWAPTTP